MFEIANLDSFFEGFASAVTITAAFFGFCSWLISRRKGVYIDNVRCDFGIVKVPKEFSVSFSSNGKTADQAVKDFHIISNRCAINLTDEDFIHLIHIPVVNKGTIFYAKVRDTNASGDSSINIDEDGVSIKNLFLPRKKGLILEIAHDGCLSRRIQSSPKSIPDFRSKSFYPPSDNPWIAIPILILLFAYGAYAAYFSFEPSNIEDAFWDVVARHFIPFAIGFVVLMTISFGTLKGWTFVRWFNKVLGTTDIEYEFILEKYALIKLVPLDD